MQTKDTLDSRVQRSVLHTGMQYGRKPLCRSLASQAFNLYCCQNYKGVVAGEMVQQLKAPAMQVYYLSSVTGAQVEGQYWIPQSCPLATCTTVLRYHKRERNPKAKVYYIVYTCIETRHKILKLWTILCQLNFISIWQIYHSYNLYY